MLEIQELRVLIAIVEAGGFQRAAKKLHLSQPAVSQSLANLERKLGEKLIDRARPLRPTLVGYELLGHAHIILDREASFLEDLERLKAGHLQTVTIAVDYLGSMRFCAPIIERFARRLPAANIKVRQLPGREIVMAVDDGLFDFGFSFFQKNMRGLAKVPLTTEVSVLVAGRKDANLRVYRRSPMEYLRATTLLTSFMDDPVVRPSQKKIRDYFNRLWQVDSLPLQLQMIEAGQGAAFVPEAVLRSSSLRRKVCRLEEVPFAKISKPYGAYYSAKSQLGHAAAVFLNCVGEV